ncbi:MAG: hypothetical protein WCK42_04235 [Myxococcaceae bacterium]
MRLLFLVLILCSAGCAKRKLVQPIQTLSSKWMPVTLKGAEQAWIIPDESSSLLIDSQCSPRNQDVPLIGLTGQLLIGMTDQILLEQKMIPYQGREALISTFVVKVDGVTQKMHILVLKKEGCVFDIVLSTPESEFEKRLPDFEKIQSLFTLEPFKK